jgi:hypothetical protein
VLFLFCLFCVCVHLFLFLYPCLDFIKHSTRLSKRFELSPSGLVGLGLSLTLFFDRDSPLHPTALSNASSCVNWKLKFLAFFCSSILYTCNYLSLLMQLPKMVSYLAFYLSSLLFSTPILFFLKQHISTSFFSALRLIISLPLEHELRNVVASAVVDSAHLRWR